MAGSKRGVRNGILSLAIKDKAVLYAAYMPYIHNGGLFIPTNKEYDLGDEVFMLLNLLDETEKNTGRWQRGLDHAKACAGQSSCGHRRSI